MRNICSIFLLSFLFVQSFGQNNYWQQKVDYNISVKLNDVDHTLDGFIKISYSNQSPDTLHFIWFHVWPNAYKNDRTAFSEQMLENGNTSFYFSKQEERGYINQLDFRVNDIHAETEDHPNDIDIVKLVLPAPLKPGESILITTPFHIKLPYNFSRSGHIGQSYQVTQWYPKPAVYDRMGWHPMPYLDQGEFYSEFGNYDVHITLPANYVVAATGELQNVSEKEWLKTRASFTWKESRYRKKIKKGTYKTIRQLYPASATEEKTLHYKQDSVVDFAWFADKRCMADHDTAVLPSGKVVDVFSFYTTRSKPLWQNSLKEVKKALQFYSAEVGEYPYAVASIVQVDHKNTGGMEYPTIAAIAVNNEKELNAVISHEVGHNWFYNILATNERAYPWMDEGINTFYDYRYNNDTGKFSSQSLMKLAFESFVAAKKDQPAALPAQQYSFLNYGLSVYYKTAQWMRLLESKMGKAKFDAFIREYYRQWKFRHPYPEDFKSLLNEYTGSSADSLFDLLNKKGSLALPANRKYKPVFIGKTDADKKYNYISFAPALGYNLYDKFMIGGLVHNYTLPFRPFQFIAAPVYATGSKKLNGIVRATYSWRPDNGAIEQIEAGISAAKFSVNTYTDSAGKITYLQLAKLAPHIRVGFRNNDARSLLSRFAQFKIYHINRGQLNFSWDSVEMINKYAVLNKATTFAQLRYVTENSRALYPYRWELQFDMSKTFGRLAYTGNYFFNFPRNGGGLTVRWFAGKFFYVGDKTSAKRFETDAYQLNLSTPKGNEDYTYSNYFLGRNAFEGFFSQQVMMRDGGFKVRTDLLSDKVGKTDDWLGALNFTLSLHKKIPVKLFADIGTYSEAWKASDASRLLFDAGLQVSLLKDIVNIYVPVVYSKVYRDYFRSYPGNDFWQRISFSIDIQHISFKKMYPALPF